MLRTYTGVVGVVLLVLYPHAVNAECAPAPPVLVSGLFCGRVLGPNDKPMAGVELRVDDNDNQSLRAKVRTDARGRFKFPQLPKGRYRLFAGVESRGDRFEVLDSAGTCGEPQTLFLTQNRSFPVECGGDGISILRTPTIIKGSGLKKDRRS